jgi:hypothetical protein
MMTVTRTPAARRVQVAEVLASFLASVGLVVEEGMLLVAVLAQMAEQLVDFVEACLAAKARLSGAPVTTFDRDFDRLTYRLGVLEAFRRGTRHSTVDQGGEALDAHPGALAFRAAREKDGVVLAASAVEAVLLDGDAGGQLLCHLLGGGLFVEVGGFAFLHSERSFRADGQAEAGAVTQFFLHDLGLAVDDLDGALGAGSDAEAAPVAELFIDVDDAADCHDVLAFSVGKRRWLLRAPAPGIAPVCVVQTYPARAVAIIDLGQGEDGRASRGILPVAQCINRVAAIPRRTTQEACTR